MQWEGARARPAKIAQRGTPPEGREIGRHGPRSEAPRLCGGALPEKRLRLLAGRKNTRNNRFRQRWSPHAGQVSPSRVRSTRVTGPFMHGQDRRNPGPRLRALEMIEERALGGRLAGILYLTGAVTALAMLVVPGVDTRHWQIMLVLTGIGLAWAASCFLLIRWAHASPLESLFSCALVFPITAVAVASTGGAASPAVFYLLFIV